MTPTPSAAAFTALPLSAATLENLAQLGYTEMTPIQAASLPWALAGHDLIAQARTGSGKTAAFALGLLAKLQPKRFDTQALVLCPTRELADQVTQEIRRLARAEDSVKVLTLVGRLEQAQSFTVAWHPLAELKPTGEGPLRSPMATIQILGGRKEKIRAGDVLGALTKDMGFAGSLIGKINVNEFSTYLAVAREAAPQVLKALNTGKVKGRSVKARAV
ncbi:hypothetical protein B566_EDAN018998 [Ephemera danica]|nr:hypothetical protein B566_EDAN018998 [Ephemera danica]